jgi:hypothetical protein
MLFCSFNFGPGMLEGDRLHNKAAIMAVTFASHPSDCGQSWASFIVLPGKCSKKMLAPRPASFQENAPRKCWHHARRPSRKML